MLASGQVEPEDVARGEIGTGTDLLARRASMPHLEAAGVKDWHVLNREAARARMTQSAPDSQPSAATGNNPQQSAATAPGILPGPEPTAPELSPMEVVHRHQDGIVTFHVKNADGEFENLFGIRAEDLQDMFPGFKQQLEADAYYSLNAYYHPEKRRRARIKATQARRPDRLK
jgi:hypothetical protein